MVAWWMTFQKVTKENVHPSVSSPKPTEDLNYAAGQWSQAQKNEQAESEFRLGSLIEMLWWDPNHTDPPGNPWIQTILQRAAGPKFLNSDVKVSWQVSTNCNYSFCCQKVTQPVRRLGGGAFSYVGDKNESLLFNKWRGFQRSLFFLFLFRCLWLVEFISGSCSYLPSWGIRLQGWTLCSEDTQQ